MKAKNHNADPTPRSTANSGNAKPEDEMARIHDLFKPLFEFHEAAEEASEHDVRMYWDFRVVRGSNTHFAHFNGVSTFPGLLAPKMLPLAPGMIQQEIIDKIAMPLTAQLMTEAEKRFKFDKEDDSFPDESGGPARMEE